MKLQKTILWVVNLKEMLIQDQNKPCEFEYSLHFVLSANFAF